MKRLHLVLFFACCLMVRPALASDQKLVHGAGTLPHLTSAITLELGFQATMPALYACRYDIGLGNRVQLGLSTCWIPGSFFGVEVHSMFNVLKTARDSDFLSLYLNQSIISETAYGYRYGYSYYYRWLYLIFGVAYEHRFGNKRRFGLYAKVGVLSEFREMRLRGGWGSYWIDCRVGFQALLGKRFSITLEPEYAVPISVYEYSWPFIGGKVALNWAF